MQSWWSSPLTFKSLLTNHNHNTFYIQIDFAVPQMYYTFHSLQVIQVTQILYYYYYNTQADPLIDSTLQSAVLLPMLFLVSLLRPHSMAVVQ